MVLTAAAFWGGSRYPALNEKVLMGADTSISGLGFDTLVEIPPDAQMLPRVLYTTANWTYTNRQGMSFGVLFGALMLWEVGRYFSHNWIELYYIEPKFHFTYYGFSWVRPWPGEWMHVHFLALGVLAVLILVGLCYRIAAALFFLGFTYVFLLDQARYLNHFYLVT